MPISADHLGRKAFSQILLILIMIMIMIMIVMIIMIIMISMISWGKNLMRRHQTAVRQEHSSIWRVSQLIIITTINITTNCIIIIIIILTISISIMVRQWCQ